MNPDQVRDIDYDLSEAERLMAAALAHLYLLNELAREHPLPVHPVALFVYPEDLPAGWVRETLHGQRVKVELTIEGRHAKPSVKR